MNKQKLSLGSSTGVLLSLLVVYIAGGISPYPAYSQTEEINMTTLANGTHLHNGTIVPEEDVTQLCGIPIFTNSSMCE